MSDSVLALWDEFLETWPPERIEKLTLEEYTAPKQAEPFTWWVEFKLKDLGGIRGGSAYKYGIFYRANLDVPIGKSRGRMIGETYAWSEMFGQTPEEAFATIHQHLKNIVHAAQKGDLEAVSAIDFTPMFKWKIAFLYQDRDKPCILPLFQKDRLFYHYKKLDPTARENEVSFPVLFKMIMSQCQQPGENLLAFSERLDLEYKNRMAKQRAAWAVPLDLFVPDNEQSGFLAKDVIESDEGQKFFSSSQAIQDTASEDFLLFYKNGQIWAWGELVEKDEDGISWLQEPLTPPISVHLEVEPQYDLVKVPFETWQALHQQRQPKVTEQENTARYWRIAPGQNARFWEIWKNQGIASIGWEHLGDLSGLSESAFNQLKQDCAEQYPDYKPQGMQQVWKFRNIKVGDQILANQGQKRIMGVGTVVGTYEYQPNKSDFPEDRHPHWIHVKWEETEPWEIPSQPWRMTLDELNREQFDLLLEARDMQPEQFGSHRGTQNIILYGPPGTGKTYATLRRALELVLSPEKVKHMTESEVRTLFDQKMREGRIEFVTFHQSYGYEEFIESIRPVLNNQDAEVKYELKDGIFKQIALRAASEGLIQPKTKAEQSEIEFDTLWQELLDRIENEDNPIYVSQQGKQYLLSTTKRKSICINNVELDDDGNILQKNSNPQTASREISETIWQHRNSLGPIEAWTYDRLEKLIIEQRKTKGGHHYTAFWIVFDALFKLRDEKQIQPQSQEKVSLETVLQALNQPGSTHQLRFHGQTPQYVLIIDEINRGNISKILGELITLLEPDKRLGAENELKLPLMYSQQRFGVPPNLHLLGTMNTADRSIALMDVALRRRFTFEEIMPNPEALASVLGQNLPEQPAFVQLVCDLLRTMNTRIAYLYDRDHQLGHAFLMGVRSPEDLCQAFLQRIIPLLQEYFYGAWDKIALILGCPYDDEGNTQRTLVHPLIVAQSYQTDPILMLQDSWEKVPQYEINPAFLKGEWQMDDLIQAFVDILAEELVQRQVRLDQLLPEFRVEALEP